MIIIFLKNLEQESKTWLSQIKELLFNIANSSRNYNNIYFQENRDELTAFINEIEEYQRCLGVLLIGTPKQESFYLAKSTHEFLKHKYENIISLSHSNFRVKLVAPFNQNNWRLEQVNQQFRLHIGPEGTTAAKIQLLGELVRPETLATALQAAFRLVPKMDYIDLSNSKLDDLSIQLLANAISGIDHYQEIPLHQCEVILLSNNKISKDGLRILLEALEKKPEGRHVILDNNLIDFDIVFCDRIVIQKSRKAQLVNLDLSMNFIPRGYMFYKDNIRIYYQEDKMARELEACNIDREKMTYIEKIFSSKQTILNSFIRVTGSLLASLRDSRCDDNTIDYNSGVIGLFANRTTIPFIGEHAYLIVEGVSKFGQRYLIRGDLYAQDDNKVTIRVSQCSPQDFFKFSGEGEKVYCRIGQFYREEIEAIIRKICESHFRENFFNYDIHGFNCITWAIDRLREATGIDMDGWHPAAVVRPGGRCNGCNIL